MKQLLYFAFSMLILSLGIASASAEHLVILHTNDTHSNIMPDKESGLGGALRRKVVIDSVRQAEPNVLLVDAGDAFQGSLYFMLYRGEVEVDMLNAQGYDIAILGNHEFDNGLDTLAKYYNRLQAEKLSSNYDFTGTQLDGMFLPYSIRNYGDKRIAIIALNIDPAGLIDSANYAGVKYTDPVVVANKLARLLKQDEKADMVIALTHIGYKPDQDIRLAKQSSDIDIIIGGHSHDTIIPGSDRSKIVNAVGDTVLVVQTGKNGSVIGKLDIDLDNMDVDYSFIPIDSRLDSRIDPEMVARLAPYKRTVDSIAAIKIGRTTQAMPGSSEGLLNFASDVLYNMGAQLYGQPVDLGIMNRGGIRHGLTKGDITKGDIMEIFPFDNRLTIVEMRGADLRTLLDTIVGRELNAGVSKGVDVTLTHGGKATDVITINGQPLDPDATYTIATIDYLAKGNDYLSPFRQGKWLERSETPIYFEMIDYIQSLGNAKIKPDTRARIHK